MNNPTTNSAILSNPTTSSEDNCVSYMAIVQKSVFEQIIGLLGNIGKKKKKKAVLTGSCNEPTCQA